MNVNSYISCRTPELERFLNILTTTTTATTTTTNSSSENSSSENLQRLQKAIPIRPGSFNRNGARATNSPFSNRQFQSMIELDSAPNLLFSRKDFENEKSQNLSSSLKEELEMSEQLFLPYRLSNVLTRGTSSRKELQRFLLNNDNNNTNNNNNRRLNFSTSRRIPSSISKKRTKITKRIQQRRRRRQRKSVLRSKSKRTRSKALAIRKIGFRFPNSNYFKKKKRFAESKMKLQKKKNNNNEEEEQLSSSSSLRVRAYCPSHRFLSKRFHFINLDEIVRIVVLSKNKNKKATTAKRQESSSDSSGWKLHHFNGITTPTLSARSTTSATSPFLSSIPVRVLVPSQSSSSKTHRRIETAKQETSTVLDCSFVVTTVALLPASSSSEKKSRTNNFSNDLPRLLRENLHLANSTSSSSSTTSSTTIHPKPFGFGFAFSIQHIVNFLENKNNNNNTGNFFFSASDFCSRVSVVRLNDYEKRTLLTVEKEGTEAGKKDGRDASCYNNNFVVTGFPSALSETTRTGNKNEIISPCLIHSSSINQQKEKKKNIKKQHQVFPEDDDDDISEEQHNDDVDKRKRRRSRINDEDEEEEAQIENNNNSSDISSENKCGNRSPFCLKFEGPDSKQVAEKAIISSVRTMLALSRRQLNNNYNDNGNDHKNNNNKHVLLDPFVSSNVRIVILYETSSPKNKNRNVTFVLGLPFSIEENDGNIVTINSRQHYSLQYQFFAKLFRNSVVNYDAIAEGWNS